MWDGYEARLDENDRDRPIPLRRTFLDVLRNSGLRPGAGVTKKMVSFKFGADERLLWEIQTPANVFLHVKWRDRVEANGFATELRPYQQGNPHGARHSALSAEWSFGDADCIVIRIDDADALRRLLAVVLNADGGLVLNPAAIRRWIARLRQFFPALDRFDRPDPDFDATERTYKLAIAADLKVAIAHSSSDDDLADAVNTALAKSNLLPWRAYWSMSSKGDADRERLWPALRALVDAALDAAEGHAAALEAFVEAWIQAVPNGKADPARQIGEFLFLHLAPDTGIYIRHSVRQDLWLEAVGSAFPQHGSIGEMYRDERRFMDAVRRAFVDHGLAPRDMIDVQSALWIIHNYKDGDAATFSRHKIEAAMDAFDRHRETGEPDAIFDAFGAPRDYWVRSTRERHDRVYPSKPIVGFLRGKTQISGGWGHKLDAAALLHNAGYIIVDADNRAVGRPDQSDHLLSGRARVQLCAANYYIAPARESGATEISIRAGDLRADLAERTPVICAALADENLQRLADVPAPQPSGPAASRDSIFTFHFGEKAEQSTMTSDPSARKPDTTNLILYGPPGTGKTYATAWEAVRLCLGMAEAERLQNDRDALMAAYRQLGSEGRIEFVTFHQSFSYEDFVEGLRPTTASTQDADDEETSASGGFSLRPHAGVFKIISERARLDTGDAPAKRLDRSRPIYKIALGQRGTEENHILESLDSGLIHLGWGGDIDWSDQRFDDFEAIRKEWNDRKDPKATGKDPNIEITYAFRSGLQIGDYVVISDGRDSFRAFGRVSGEYYLDGDADFHPHRRPVEWIWRDDDGAERAQFYTRNFRRQSAYRLDPSSIDWDALESVVINANAERPVEGARPHVLIIDEINRANISKVFGELITLLETDKRLGCDNEVKVRLPYSGASFGVPANLHIVGTMNTADRSIALLDTALRRRFTFRELMPDVDALRQAMAARQLDAENLDGIDLCKLLRTLNERIEYLFDREHQIGHAYFTGCASRADVDSVMRHKVIPLLAEYFYEDWSKVAAVLGDGDGGSRFLESRRLMPPAGFAGDDMGEDKLRWSVKASFDFSDFAA